MPRATAFLRWMHYRAATVREPLRRRKPVRFLMGAARKKLLGPAVVVAFRVKRGTRTLSFNVYRCFEGIARNQSESRPLPKIRACSMATTEQFPVLHMPRGFTTAASTHSVSRAEGALRANTALLFVMVVVIAAACRLRWSLVTSLPWQCDELPLLMRNTGVAGHVANEADARRFIPSLYTARKGALRSLRSRGTIAQHTMAGFWTNLTVHLFGCNPAAGRIAPMVWSIVAVFGVAWAAWLATGRLRAGCLAAWVVALSPHAVAYGAQARGYAEALALTPLLLIALEYFRRRPDRRIRGLAVFLCSFQLALTIYTMWIYWVFPAVIMMVAVLPGTLTDDADRRTLRAVSIAVGAGLCAAMTVYTIDRWDKLTFVASYVASFPGSGVDLFTRLSDFVGTLAERLLVAPGWIVLVALVGIPVLWRSRVRWWLLLMAAGIAVPGLFALANGSPGYTRNFGYLIAPVAILCGIGGDALIRAMQTRVRIRHVPTVAAMVVLAASAWAYPRVDRRARALLLPDWGALVSAVNQEPELNGPRWFCSCRANYWQINWYQKPINYAVFLDAEAGAQIELVMGAQLDEAGIPTVYRLSSSDGTIRAAALPDYLRRVSPVETRSGIEVRRWVGTKCEGPVREPRADQSYAARRAAGFSLRDMFRNEGVANVERRTSKTDRRRSRVSSPTSGPALQTFDLRPSTFDLQDSSAVFVLIAKAEPFTIRQWKRFLEETNGTEQGIVTFKTSVRRSGIVESMIAPASLLPAIRATLIDALDVDPVDINAFSLTTIDAHAQWATVPTRTAKRSSRPTT